MSDRKVAYARNGTVHIAYDVRGHGERDVVAVPPWFSNIDLFDQLPAIERAFDRVTRFARLIRYDRRGSGLSDRMCGHATLEEGVEDLVAVLDAVGAEKVVLFGINEAGSLCALAAATIPERIGGLVLYGTYASTLWQPDYPWAPRPEQRDEEVKALIEFWGTPEMAGAINAGSRPDKEFLDWAARWMRSSVSKDELPRAYELLSKTDVRHVLPSIRVPTLVLHRTEDAVVDVANGRYVADHIPGARFVELDGTDHLPFFGDWDPIMDEIEEFLTGVRPTHDDDRILATILFVDIVGSTELAGKLGDRAWRDRVADFERATRREVDRRGGRVVKTLGDGVLATFAGPARAIDAARRLTERLEGLDLKVRCGIHTGEVEVVPGDVIGIAVHIAARVTEHAGACEVVVSGAVPPLVAGAGFRFEDRGVHPLRGVEGEWHVLRVQAPP